MTNKSFKLNQKNNFFLLTINFEKKTLTCSSIEHMSLPASVKQISDNCFHHTRNLKEIEISPKNKNFKLIDVKYVAKESNAGSCVFDVIILVRRDIESISITPHIKVINNYAFHFYQHLKTIKFESNSSLKSINNRAQKH